MNPPAIVEIFGTVTPPFLPETTEGFPRILITAKARSGSTQRLVAYCGGQLSGSTLPFSLRVDRTVLDDAEALTLEAGCASAPGEDSQVAKLAIPLVLDDLDKLGPLDLQLQPVGSLPEPDTGKRPVEASIIPLNLSVVIPDELVKADTHLDVVLLRVQENGQSNRNSSNIVEASFQHNGNGSPFTLYLDANVLAEHDQLKLHVAQYNLERSAALAGYVIRNLGPNDLHDFGQITLRGPRKGTPPTAIG